MCVCLARTRTRMRNMRKASWRCSGGHRRTSNPFASGHTRLTLWSCDLGKKVNPYCDSIRNATPHIESWKKITKEKDVILVGIAEATSQILEGVYSAMTRLPRHGHQKMIIIVARHPRPNYQLPGARGTRSYFSRHGCPIASNGWLNVATMKNWFIIFSIIDTFKDVWLIKRRYSLAEYSGHTVNCTMLHIHMCVFFTFQYNPCLKSSTYCRVKRNGSYMVWMKLFQRVKVCSGRCLSVVCFIYLTTCGIRWSSRKMDIEVGRSVKMSKVSAIGLTVVGYDALRFRVWWRLLKTLLAIREDN